MDDSTTEIDNMEINDFETAKDDEPNEELIVNSEMTGNSNDDVEVSNFIA